MSDFSISRRGFLRRAAALSGAVSLSCGGRWAAAADPPKSSTADREDPGFRLNYILGAPMYGQAPLAEVLPEVLKIDARQIDIWPKPHANHVEQADAMGLDRFAAMLADHGVKLGVITRYDLGPKRIGEEIPKLKRLGGRMLITGAGRGEGISEQERVKRFVEKMRPQVEQAEELGLIFGIENHANTLLHSPDSIRRFAELATSPHLGLAMAPYHLPQEPALIAKLIEDLGPKLVFFQAWQHGKGCAKKLPKEQEMLQMPGRGPLDFRPILAALAAIDYPGWTEIFMHPVPRGIPIRESTAEVTAEINQARAYLDRCLAEGTPAKSPHGKSAS